MRHYVGYAVQGQPRATNAWRVYELASGEQVDSIGDQRFASPPPVPTTSIFSRTDGVVAWRCSVERETATTENIEVEASHIGLGVNPAAILAIADRLAQPEGAWRKFDRNIGLRRLFYKDPLRHERRRDWAPRLRESVRDRGRPGFARRSHCASDPHLLIEGWPTPGGMRGLRRVVIFLDRAV